LLSNPNSSQPGIGPRSTFRKISAPSILLLGASDYLGVPLLAEFLSQREKFKQLAILTDESRKHKFTDTEVKGAELMRNLTLSSHISKLVRLLTI
jgi:hypothetical protein